MTVHARAAIVVTGSRAQLFTGGLARRDRVEIAALCALDRMRTAHHDRLPAVHAGHADEDGSAPTATGIAANTAFEHGEPANIDDVVRIK
jgi:hypothetical protein